MVYSIYIHVISYLKKVKSILASVGYNWCSLFDTSGISRNLINEKKLLDFGRVDILGTWFWGACEVFKIKRTYLREFE